MIVNLHNVKMLFFINFLSWATGAYRGRASSSTVLVHVEIVHIRVCLSLCHLCWLTIYHNGTIKQLYWSEVFTYVFDIMVIKCGNISDFGACLMKEFLIFPKISLYLISKMMIICMIIFLGLSSKSLKKGY